MDSALIGSLEKGKSNLKNDVGLKAEMEKAYLGIHTHKVPPCVFITGVASDLLPHMLRLVCGKRCPFMCISLAPACLQYTEGDNATTVRTPIQ